MTRLKIFEKMKIVATENRTHADRMSVQHLTTMPTVPTGNRDLWKSAFENEIIFVSKIFF